jgi:hypothetical protein
MMTFAALHPQESMLQAAAFEVIGKFLFHMQGQVLALHWWLINRGFKFNYGFYQSLEHWKEVAPEDF